MRGPALLATALAALAGCGGDGARLRLAPTNAGPCGHPDDARTILVTPLGDFLASRRALDTDAAVTLADLPAATRSFAVEILGAGGQTAAIGRTAPFQLDALADGDTIPIAMAPPDGMCPAGTLTTPRDRARIARVGDGVLVVGGAAPASAERYDPATETTTAIPLPTGFGGDAGVVGAALAALPDGRAVLIGGPRPGFAIYEPGRGFAAATLLTELRAHHVAIALDDRRVLVAAGCGVVGEDGACEAGDARLNARIVDLVTGEVAPGPPLAVARLDGDGVLEIDAAGRASVLLTGGLDTAGAPVTAAERIFLDGGASQILPGAGAALARLDSGAALTAFAPPGTAPSGAGAVVVPGGAAVRPTPTAPARAGAVLVTQDDGLVLGLGGGAPLRYRPSQHDWRVLADPGVALAGAPAALRWDDGTVLVFGGRDGGGAPSAAVWRFRPRLLGPFAGALAVVPGDADADPPLTPLDPAAIDRSGGWLLGGAAPSWAIVGGPTGGVLRVELSADVPATGVAILTGFVDPAHHDRLAIVPGQPILLEEVRGGVATTRCRGQAAGPAGPTAIAVELDGASVRVVAGGAIALTCTQDDRARGRVGVAALGEAVAIESIAIGR